jgi:hypothetical protein
MEAKMLNDILLYLGGVITLLWGVSHLFPTKSVVKGLGEISEDNKNIITMEWIVEGVALIFIGFIVIGVTIIGTAGVVTLFIYYSSAGCLIVLAVVSVFTGFRINFFAFKMCPYLFTISALLIILGNSL